MHYRQNPLDPTEHPVEIPCIDLWIRQLEAYPYDTHALLSINLDQTGQLLRQE
jgi:hypothetical protein